jgi:hypothetical protein
MGSARVRLLEMSPVVSVPMLRQNQAGPKTAPWASMAMRILAALSARRWLAKEVYRINLFIGVYFGI